MRIAVFVNADIHAYCALNMLRPFLQHHTVWLGYSTQVGKPQADIPPLLQALRFYEQTLPMHVLFPKLEAAGTAGHGQWLSIAQLAHAHQWPLTAIEALNTPGLIESVRAFAPEVMISIRFGKIFKDDWLHLASHGILNLHSGLLPQYRGVLATFWALLRGEAEYGCTLHWIDAGTIDTGSRITEVRLPTQAGKSLLSHIIALYPPGMAAMQNALRQLAAGQRPASEPQNGAAQYFSYPSANDCHRFAAQGIPLIDYADYTALLQRFGAAPG